MNFAGARLTPDTSVYVAARLAPGSPLYGKAGGHRAQRPRLQSSAEIEKSEHESFAGCCTLEQGAARSDVYLTRAIE
jgi:hypothetical protein